MIYSKSTTSSYWLLMFLLGLSSVLKAVEYNMNEVVVEQSAIYYLAQKSGNEDLKKEFVFRMKNKLCCMMAWFGMFYLACR